MVGLQSGQVVLSSPTVGKKRYKAMYIGAFQITLDDKNRASIPKEIRDLLEAESIRDLVLAMDRDESKNEGIKTYSYLDLVPWPEWVKRMEKLSQKAAMNPVVARYMKYYVMPAKKVSLDTAGRILIPQRHREWAGLKRDVVIVSAVSNWQIWDAEQWNESFAETTPDIPDIKRDLAEILEK